MIVTVPNPVLTNRSKEVAQIDRKVLGLISKMKKTLTDTRSPKGVGLAAPQIGIPLRIFITRPREDSVIETFINPEIVSRSIEMRAIERDDKDSKPSIRKEKKLEGCLSIPKIWGYLLRSHRVKIKFLDVTGKAIEREYAGFMATIVQHETDHLNGILFTQRVLEQKQKLYRIEKDEEGKEKFVEIEI